MTVPQILFTAGLKNPSATAQWTKNGGDTFHKVTWGELIEQAGKMGAGLAQLGVKRGFKVGIISDNRAQWLVSDLAILGLGAVDVPRGADSTSAEVRFILNHSESLGVMCEDKVQWEKIKNGPGEDPKLQWVVFLTGNKPESEPKGPLFYSWDEVVALGEKALVSDPELFTREWKSGNEDELATIIYTSGTTGEPKGVMLAHRSFQFQINGIENVIEFSPDDIVISVLPVWHSFERSVEYIVLSHGASIAYSKPQGKILIADMAAVKPTLLPSVPRIWEGVRSSVLRSIKSKSLVQRLLFSFFLGVAKLHTDLLMLFQGRVPQFHLPTFPWDSLFSFIPLLLLSPINFLGNVLVFSKIKKILGGRFKAGISGGGALPGYVDHFFRAVGIHVLEGYGLTETGPVLSCREIKRPVPRTVGPLLPGIEYKVVAEDGRTFQHGEKGVLWVKSPQVMLGYFKNPEKTAEVLKDGWLNTGDLVLTTIYRDVKIVGRAKDTIVLRGGENIEPEPIELMLQQIEAIEQVMIVGQDQKFLGALIYPNWEIVEKLASEKRIPYYEKEELLQNNHVVDFFNEKIQETINHHNGFKSFERIVKIFLQDAPFLPEVEVTATLKLKRNVIQHRRASVIKGLFNESQS